MRAYKSDFLNVLAERGFIHQVSEPDALDARAKAGAITGYIGFDCTAASLHVGSLLPIMMLYWMQQTGHRPIALMGGGTTRVGDPSGKDESRRILTDEMIEREPQGHPRHLLQVPEIRRRPGGNAVMANNADWLNSLNYIDFLRDVGRHFSVNRMLSFDSVKLRLDRQQELSFLEFNYMVLQAYDFVELNKRTGCILQMGGSDQWGNIVNGIDLGRRMHERAAVRADLAADHHVVGRQDGQDRGRRGLAQRRPGQPLRLLAILAQHRGRRRRPLPQAVHGAAARRDRAARRAQGRRTSTRPRRVLATEATALGARPRRRRPSRRAPRASTFEEGTLAETLPTRRPRTRFRRRRASSVLTAFVEAGLVASNGEARRQIKNGGLKVNDAAVTDEKMLLTPAMLTPEGVIKLSLGKKRHVLLKPK